MWAEESVWYQIYPLGLCGAPYENDGVEKPRIRKVLDWIPHLEKLGIQSVYFGPVFESDTHGYNTRDYRKIDVRLGSDEDFQEVCEALHQKGIKVVLDGVFNHVGRGFPEFMDVVKNRENSRYLSWFQIDLNGNSNYNDGLWYEGWEGCYDLVKLNLRNPEVVQYLLESVELWMEKFRIDGLRLDVAYSLDYDFVRQLRSFCDNKAAEMGKEFFLLGEMLHGDYNCMVNQNMLHSATNYECYKGLHSSFNSMNLFEIMHSLLRQFGPEEWTLYKGKHLLSFVDNHDVSRIASILTNKEHLSLIYGMLFTMPGIPCIYYGSEWGATGKKEGGDPSLRLSYAQPEWNDLTDTIAKLIKIKKESHALNYGGIRSILLTNQQCIFERASEKERILIGINGAENSFHAFFDAGCEKGMELMSDREQKFQDGVELQGYSISIWRV